MKKLLVRLSCAIPVLSLLAGCVQMVPVNMNTDPNQQDHQKVQEKMDNSDLDAFISEHPEFDEETKIELRKGTLTRSEALKRQPKPNP